MIRSTRTLFSLAILLVGAGCAGAMNSGTGPAGRANLITFEEMRERGQSSSLYDLIQELRPRWLRSQGPDTFLGSQGQVQVHMDGNQLGSVEVLRRMASHGVTSIAWMPPIDAGARFGMNHSHGAIIISTAPAH